MAASGESVEERIRGSFLAADIPIRALRHISHVDEDVFLLDVEPSDMDAASAKAAELDEALSAEHHPVMISVRRAQSQAPREPSPMPEGVSDPRAVELRQLISARSRASEVQPSLSYIPDSSMNMDAVAGPRHQLIFGRRGAGKTALMVEAKKRVDGQGQLSAWINVQTYRLEPMERVLLYTLKIALDAIRADARITGSASPTIDRAYEIAETVETLLEEDDVSATRTSRLIPNINETLKRYLQARGVSLYLFIDDFYYVPRRHQPSLLDMLHSCVRDTSAFLKIASIRNLTKWFITSPPRGLETGHDADLIDLDITLQDPNRAKDFLERVLQQYATAVGVPRLTSVFSPSSLDRLTLASGGVPRDFLVLSGASILKTRERPNRKLVGVQDVNEAAGDAAQVKVQELEEDGSSNSGVPEQASKALLRVRQFCLVETSYTYFRVRHEDRDHHPEAFGVLNRLVEFRLLHLLAPSVSNPHKAGDASELYMLDLSQFTGSRLKQKLWVLDIDNGRISSKRTRDAGSEREAAESRELTAIFRLAPEFSLDRLADLISTPDVPRAEVLTALNHGQTRTISELVSELQKPFANVSVTVDDLMQAGLVVSREVEGRLVYAQSDAAEKGKRQ